MTRKSSYRVPPIIFVIITTGIIGVMLWSAWQKSLARPNIQGNWSTSCVQEQTSSGQKASLKKSYKITKSEWTLSEDFYSDENCGKIAYTRITKGTYEIGDKSKQIQDAFHIEMGLSAIYLNPRSPDVVQVFDQLNCGDTEWQINIEQEIGKDGCVGLAKNLSRCPIEFNVIKKQDTTLVFGDGQKNYCTRYQWPESLGKTVFEKQL